MTALPPLGPYALAPRAPERRFNGTWHIEVIVPGTDRHELASGRTLAETQDRAAALLRKYGARLGADPRSLTLSGAAVLYVHWCTQRRDWTDRTVLRMRADLLLFVGDEAARRLVDVDDAVMEAWLDRLSGSNLSLSSQQSRWASSVGFLIWCRQRRLMTADPASCISAADKPWTSRRGRKRLKRGKAQLRHTAEAQAFLEHAGQLPDARSRVAVQLPLLAGLATGEVLHLQVGDIDFTAGVGHVREDSSGVPGSEWEVKADSRRRIFRLPAHLVADLLAICADQQPDVYLFASSRRTRRGAPYQSKWLLTRVKRVCEAAGVRTVCTHGLRGTYATMLTVHSGATSPEIARYLGHADQGETAQNHYIGAATRAPTLRLIGERDEAVSVSNNVRNPEGTLVI